MLAPGLRLRGCLALAALLACCTAGLTGRAEPPPRVALAWERAPGASGCVAREAAVQMIQRRLRRTPFTESNADFTIAARLDQPAEGRWEATFVVSRADGSFVGRRTLSVEAPSCRVLDGPMALVLTLLAEAPERAAEPAPLPSSSPSSAPSSAPSAEPPPEPPPPASASAPAPPASSGSPPPEVPPLERAPLSGSLSLGVLDSRGSVPGLGLGARLGATLGSARWRVRADASYQFAGTTPSDGPGVRVSSLQLGAAGCARSGAVAGLRFEGCAGLRAGPARGTGKNLSEESTATVLTHGITAHGALLLPLGPLALRASLGAQVATARARFFYDTPSGAAIPWKASPVQPEVDLSLELPWGP